MLPKPVVGLAVLAFAADIVSGNLHLARHGLLQFHPSFTGDGITLYPGHHPEHDADHLMHVEPQLEHVLHYSQEGHRPAMHGSKHGSLSAKFVRPTVILDHTNHLKSVDCSRSSKAEQMRVCFSNTEAFEVARRTWNVPDLNIVTFHVGCGDELSGKRSFFHSRRRPLSINAQTRCIIFSTREIEHEDALESGEIRWGTYEHPEYKKRVPALGHVRMDGPDDPGEDTQAPEGETGDDPPPADTSGADPPEPSPTDDTAGDEPPEASPTDDTAGDEPSETTPADGSPTEPEPTAITPAHPTEDDPDGNHDGEDDNGIDEYLAMALSPRPMVNIKENATALEDFFIGLEFDDSDMQNSAPPEDDLPFIYEDGFAPTIDNPNDDPNGGDPVFDAADANPGDSDPSQEGDQMSRRRAAARNGVVRRQHQRMDSYSSRTDLSTHLEERFIQSIVDGISVVSFFKSFVKVIAIIASVIVEIAIISGKLIAAAFGVPFSHSYHNDFKFDYQPEFSSTNKPPNIFNVDNGVELAGNGAFYNVQCAKCGIHADFSVDGVLAFSIKEGVTKGSVSFVNNEAFTIDAQFGIQVELQAEKSIDLFKKQLGSLPLSPLTIPGIILLGPEVTVSVELELTLNGQADLLIGGSLSVSKGRAVMDAVNPKRNELTGLKAEFTPVAQLNGTITASMQLGLPIALEVGLDILNGKWKKSVGLVDKPSVYVSATVSKNVPKKCSNGVEIRVGVKNQLYLSVLDYYEVPIRTDTIYERGLVCISSQGFDFKNVGEATAFNQAIAGSPGRMDQVAGSKPQFTNVSQSLTPKIGKTGYRIIVDQGQTSIVVAGKDGGVYLVMSDEKYDISAPWGTLDLKSNLVNLDVFGRIMSVNFWGTLLGLAEVRLVDPKYVPEANRVASLNMVKEDSSKEYQGYAIVVGEQDDKQDKGHLVVRYPTFCKTPKGTRLFATQWIINDKGQWLKNDKKPPGNKKLLDAYKKVLTDKRYGVKDPAKDCRTVRLTSKPS